MKKFLLALLLSLSMSSAFAGQSEGNSFPVWYYIVCFAAAPFAPFAAAGAIAIGTVAFAGYETAKQNR
jgi:hypothetical protein